LYISVLLGRKRKMVANWIKREEGSTAVEFAMVAVPFIYLLLGIIEMSLMFVGMSTLDSAAGQASRVIRTGQAQQSVDPEQAFKDALCAAADTFLDCNKIQYEVVKMNGFSDFSSFPISYDENGDLISQGFDAGSVDDVILIRAVYKYPLMTPLMGSLLSDSAGNTKLFVTTIVLETEPYDVDLVAEEL